MEIKESATEHVKIFMAGNIEDAKRYCREFCFAKGFCVSIYETSYIYTGGEESGFVVELINYPRFPSAKAELLLSAVSIGNGLMAACFQNSFTIMTKNKTFWHSRRLPEPKS